jgi:choline dehydrogenase-like flavoprotein
MGRTIRVAVMGEDLPELSNVVELDDQMSDSNGVPSPKINYSESENSKKLIKFGVDRAVEVLDAAGAKSVLHDPLLRAAGWHLMGTARMGTDAERSVVDRFGACHDVKNLYVIDGSIFVTAGAVNPTSTIQALALYIADNLKKR